jgi:3-hydroxymyristoyl/3-hydroxydecanoyl-(acyl carrier protein) dehydratase
MADRFSAFSFVDHIASLEPGAGITGRYAIPRAATRFPPSLVAEAVGQLAAWAAMSQIGFARRPVAGLARETRYFGMATPGDHLDLAVEIQSCDENAIAYGGTAIIGGSPVLRLRDCLGPMLPMEDFDDPEAVRADFEILRGRGAPADRFRGVPPPEIKVNGNAASETLVAELRVPPAAPFFADHFPRRPVYPGTLLLDALSTLVLQFARDTLSLRHLNDVAVSRVTDVKIRSFTPPGQILEIRAELIGAEDQEATFGVAARAGGKSVATAKITVAPGARS